VSAERDIPAAPVIAGRLRLDLVPTGEPGFWQDAAGDTFMEDAPEHAFAPRDSALRPAREGQRTPRDERHPPRPLGEDAYHGPAGAFVRHLEPATEADPAAVLIQTLVMFGNALGRQAGFQVGFTEHWTNESTVIVGLTSSGRKGTGADLPRHAIGKADETWRGRIANGGLVSGEGVIFHVRDEEWGRRKAKKGEQADVDGWVTELADEGVADKRLMIVEPEFSSVLRVLRRETNTLVGVLRGAWDGLSPLRVLAKNSANIATGAHVSTIGHITEHELRAELAETEAFSGFANRQLWVCSDRSKLLPDGPPVVGMTEHVERFARALDRSDLPKLLERDEGARELWHCVYPSLTAGREGVFGAATSRAEAHVARLAVIYAALDRDVCVRVEHLRAALEVWRYCEESAAFIFGGRLEDPVAERLLQALKSAPEGLTKRQMRDVLGHHVKADRMDVALGFLAARDLADGHAEPTGGRPRELWKPRARGAKPQDAAQSPADASSHRSSSPAAAPAEVEQSTLEEVAAGAAGGMKGRPATTAEEAELERARHKFGDLS